MRGQQRQAFGRSRQKLQILHEDSEVIVLDKPPGLPTANAARGSDSLVIRLQGYLGSGAFAGVVSRLDLPVSGAVVFAKNPAAAASLAQQFRDRTVAKDYLAIVERRFPAPVGEWRQWRDWIGWNDSDRRAVARVQLAKDPSGPDAQPPPGCLEAETFARVVRRVGEVSLVELRPATGRKHQLRSQLAARGCPIVGDRKYGARLPLPGPLGAAIALHANSISFDHPQSGSRMIVSATVPHEWELRFPGLFPN